MPRDMPMIANKYANPWRAACIHTVLAPTPMRIMIAPSGKKRRNESDMIAACDGMIVVSLLVEPPDDPEEEDDPLEPPDVGVVDVVVSAETANGFAADVPTAFDRSNVKESDSLCLNRFSSTLSELTAPYPPLDHIQFVWVSV